MRVETDIELCKITDAGAKQKIMYALMKAGIPYAEEWEKIPLVKRKKYNGAKEICSIITHKAMEEQAISIIMALGSEVKDAIIW